MSKFATFLVFLFGVFVMIAVAVIFTQRRFFAPPPPKEEKMELPESTLPELELGTREQFATMLSQLSQNGGVDAVRRFMERELVPGRALVAREFASDKPSSRRLVDRELRYCDIEGVAPLDKPPVLPRAAPVLRMSGKVEVQTVARTEVTQPFVIRIWWIPADEK